MYKWPWCVVGWLDGTFRATFSLDEYYLTRHFCMCCALVRQIGCKITCPALLGSGCYLGSCNTGLGHGHLAVCCHLPAYLRPTSRSPFMIKICGADKCTLPCMKTSLKPRFLLAIRAPATGRSIHANHRMGFPVRLLPRKGCTSSEHFTHYLENSTGEIKVHTSDTRFNSVISTELADRKAINLPPHNRR